MPGQRDARAAVVEQWLNAGFDVGNHAYSHKSASMVPVDQFTDDVIKGEVITRAILEQRGQQLVWLRYPYLHSGATAEAHQAIVDFLEKRNYRHAPVTVDYADYTFAGAYTREGCAAEMLRWLTGSSRPTSTRSTSGFAYAEKSSLELYGREIAQILLIHCNELNSVSLRDSITRMRKRGYTFISLEEAMKDEAYHRPDTFAGPGGSSLSRTATVMGKSLTPETVRAATCRAEVGRGSPVR